MRCLVIGLGSIGTRHAKNLYALGLKPSEILVYDPQPRSVEHVTHVANLEIGFAQKPDAVLICSPPALHEEHALAAFPHCQKVFIEKPLSLTTDAAIRICQQAEAFGVTVGAGFMLRAHPIPRWVKQQIEAGDFGTIHAAHFECCWQPKPTSYPWPGVIVETCHELDLACWMFGYPNGHDDERGYWTSMHQDSHARAAQLMFYHGTIMTSFHFDTLSTAYRRSVTIYGGKATGRFEYGGETSEWDKAYRLELDAFLKGEPLCTAREALETVKLCEAMG